MSDADIPSVPIIGFSPGQLPPGAKGTAQGISQQGTPPKMIVQVLSDLHLERAGYDGVITAKAPYLVLAGDIGDCIGPDRGKYKLWLARQCKNFHRIFVILGNNEPKGKGKHTDGWEEATNWMRKCAGSEEMKGGLKFLERSEVDMMAEVGNLDVIILGCTLWSRIRQDQPDAGRTDTLAIKLWKPRPQKNNEVFERSYNWLKDTVKDIRQTRRKSARILVITHHAPCFGTSKAGQDKTGPNWSSYQNDILGGEGVEGLRRGDTWVFGHTHFTCDFTQDEVRVYSNARGRPKEVTPGYFEDKVISV